MSYTVTNNSPSAGYISWSSVRITFDGITYTVSNSSTNKKYAYWLKEDFATSSPWGGSLRTSDAYPTLGPDDCLVFINKGGICLSVLDSAGVDGSLVVPGTILSEAIAAKAIRADHLDSNVITATKLLLSDRANLYPDFDFDDPDFYAWGAGVSPSYSSTTTDGLGRRYLRITPAAGTISVTSGWFPVDTATDYALTAYNWLSSSDSNTTVSVSLQFGTVAADGTVSVSRTIPVGSSASAFSAVTSKVEANTQSLLSERRARFVVSRVSASGAGTAIAAAGGFKVRRRANASLIVDGEVVAGKLSADAVTSGTIAAGAVNTRELAAGAVTASRMLIGDTTNLFSDPDLNDATWPVTPTFNIGAPQAVVTKPDAARVIRYVGANPVTPSGTTTVELLDSPVDLLVAVQPGDKLRFSCQIQSHINANGTAGVYLRWFDSSKTATGQTSVASPELPTSGVVSVGANVVVPEGATYLGLRFRRGASADGVSTSGWVNFACIRINRRLAGEMVVDGTLTAAHLAAGEFAAGVAAINTAVITDAMIANLSADKINAGFMSAARLSAGVIDATGKIVARGLDIQDEAGNTILSAVSGSSPSSVFNSIKVWNFDGSADGWAASGASVAASSAYLTVTSSSNDPTISVGNLLIVGANWSKVRVRLRRKAGSGWDGTLYYATAGHGWSAGYRKVVGAPSGMGWVVLEWDMTSLTAGGSDWTSNTITGLRLDLGATTADIFDIDWIAVGSYSPSSSSWDDLQGTNKPQNNATVGAPAGTLVGGTLAETVVSNAASGAAVALNFNANNDRNGTTPTAPTIATDGSAIDHTVNTDGSVNISFEWSHPYSSSTTPTTAEDDIDGFLVYVRQDSSSAPRTIGTTPKLETVYTLPANRRALILNGLPADRYYTFGVRAYRAVDSDINISGLRQSAVIQPTASDENPYRPASSVAFTGDITGTVAGTSASTVVSNAASGAAAATNFNTRNDRNSTTPTAPTIVSDGSAVEHTVNTDGSVNISLEWVHPYSSTTTPASSVDDIDGFLVYVRQDTSSAARTIGTAPSLETVYTMPADRRALIINGLPADRYYTFGVRAYRAVDSDIHISGLKQSAVVQPSAAGENPYRPSASVAFTGDITGTVAGTSASTVVSNAASGAAAAVNFNANNDRNGTIPTAPTITADGTAVDHVINTDGTASVSLEWAHPYSSSSTAASSVDDIDGFLVYLRQSASSASVTIGTSAVNETVYTLPANRRALIVNGLPADRYYTFGVRAYRVVDSDIDASGLKQSPVIQPSLAEENPYRPSATVAFAGDITGTVSGTAASTVVSNAAAGKAANDAVNNATTGLAAKLSSNSRNVLAGQAGFVAGTLNWDASGTPTSGTGVAMTAKGIACHDASQARFVLGIDGSATFAGALSAATGTFAGSLSAATGTFAGSLSAATGTFSGTLTAAAVDAVGTVNIAGDAVTVPRTFESTTSYVGNGAWQTVMSVSFSMAQAGKIIAMWQAGQSYGAMAETNWEVYINGTLAGSGNGGGDYSRTAMVFAFGNGVSGSNSVVVKWWSTASVTLSPSGRGQKLVVMGAMR